MFYLTQKNKNTSFPEGNAGPKNEVFFFHFFRIPILRA
eukprot:UN10674